MAAAMEDGDMDWSRREAPFAEEAEISMPLHFVCLATEHPVGDVDDAGGIVFPEGFKVDLVVQIMRNTSCNVVALEKGEWRAMSS